ncbi:MAG TPA: energy transducer TonB [Candidatus Angelobacter sp.]|nr:energy transducer TonB [Candidatus Angelobacter sp.]
MPFDSQIFVSSEPAPRRWIILLSGGAHVLALVLLVALRHATGPYVVPQNFESAQAIPLTEHLSYNPAWAKAAPLNAGKSQRHKSKSRIRLIAPESEAVAEGAAVKALREHAASATTGMTDNIRVSQFYGLHWDDYQLAIQTAGKLPVISADELPPHFQQLVTVEVTIDVDGRVADARIIGGLVTRPIEQKLLAAIREFKYNPAKHYGAPIPSQLDLVVHIPS